MVMSLQVINLIFVALRCHWKSRGTYVSTNFQLIIFYGLHMCGGFLMTVITQVHLYFRFPFEIFLVYNYAILCYVFLLMHILKMHVRILL